MKFLANLLCSLILNSYLMDNIIKYNDAVQQRQNESPDAAIIGQVSGRLYDGVVEIIDNARKQVAVYVNVQTSMTFWNVGSFIINDMEYQAYSAYGQKILATLSQKLMARYGKGYTYSALTIMMKRWLRHCRNN